MLHVKLARSLAVVQLSYILFVEAAQQPLYEFVSTCKLSQVKQYVQFHCLLNK